MIGLIFRTKNNWTDNYGIFRKAFSSNQCNFRLHGELHLCQKTPVSSIDEGILEVKTECYEKNKVKIPPFFQSFYDNFQSFFRQLPLYLSQNQTVILRC